jgi:acetyl-CoA carboxylase biotin carboxyl carrier protein
MQLDHDQLHHLLALLGESDIQEFKLEGDDFRLLVRRNLPSAPPTPPAPVQVVADSSGSSAPPAPPVTSAPPPAVATRADLQEITAPMVGTFYRSSAPGEPPFVEIGSRIKAGQTVCILDAMKLMNELEADVDGEVVEILVENGTPVEFAQVLMRIKPV